MIVEDYKVVIDLNKVRMKFQLEIKIRQEYLLYLNDLKKIYENSMNPKPIDLYEYACYAKYLNSGDMRSDNEAEELMWLGFDFPPRLKKHLDIIENGIPNRTLPVPILSNFLTRFKATLKEGIVWR